MNHRIRGIRARAYRSLVLAIPCAVALAFGIGCQGGGEGPAAWVEVAGIGDRRRAGGDGRRRVWQRGHGRNRWHDDRWRGSRRGSNGRIGRDRRKRCGSWRTVGRRAVAAEPAAAAERAPADGRALAARAEPRQRRQSGHRRTVGRWRRLGRGWARCCRRWWRVDADHGVRHLGLAENGSGQHHRFGNDAGVHPEGSGQLRHEPAP